MGFPNLKIQQVVLKLSFSCLAYCGYHGFFHRHCRFCSVMDPDSHLLGQKHVFFTPKQTHLGCTRRFGFYFVHLPKLLVHPAFQIKWRKCYSLKILKALPLSLFLPHAHCSLIFFLLLCVVSAIPSVRASSACDVLPRCAPSSTSSVDIIFCRHKCSRFPCVLSVFTWIRITNAYNSYRLTIRMSYMDCQFV